MSRGLIAKTVREGWRGTLIVAGGLAALEVLLAYILQTFYREFGGQWLELSFVQDLFKALLGTEIGTQITPDAVTAIAWVHPMVLALIWAHAIVSGTRLPAGEVDRGTIDVLLGLPASRTRIYGCELVGWLGSGLVVIVMGLVGNLVGGWWLAREPQGVSAPLIMVVANLYCLYIAVGGMACLASSLSDRRGRAVGVAFAIVVASFLLNFLVQFWQPARAVSFLSVLDYYRPIFVFRDARWPVGDMLTLTLVGAALWTTGAVIFARRDIRTV